MWPQHHDTRQPPSKKLRTACDTCHQAKMRCSGGVPCAACAASGHQCCYSVSNRTGRPKGTKNKRTIEQQNQARNQQKEGRQPSAEIQTEMPPISTVDGPQQSSAAFAACTDGAMSFDNMMVDSASSNEMSYSLPGSESSFWDTISYGFMPDLALEESQKSSRNSISPLASQPTQQTRLSNSLEKELEPTLSHPDPPLRTSSGDGREPTQRSSPFRPRTPSSCNCLQNHAELLCRLKEFEQRYTSPSLDVLLHSTQQALEPWKRLISCNVCHQNDDQEVLLLSAMTMRSLIRRFLDLCSKHGSRSSLLGSGDDDTGRGPPRDGLRFTVGIYQVVGEEQAWITDMLLWHTLRRIKCALKSLQVRLDNSMMRQRVSSAPLSAGGPMESFGGDRSATDHSIDTNHVQHLIHTFQGNVQSLEQILKGNQRFISAFS